MSLLMQYILNISAKVLLAVAALSFSCSGLAQEKTGRYLPQAGQAAPVFPFLQGANKEKADAAWQFYQKNIGQPMTKWAH